jgi:multidrug resistance efflux pump
MKIKRITLVLLSMLVGAGILLSACSLFPGSSEPTPTPTASAQPVAQNLVVISEGQLAPKEQKYLAFQGGGEVAEVLVTKGDLVSTGQVLARLSGKENAEAAMAAAQLELTAAQQAHDELVRLADVAHQQAWQALLTAETAVITTGRAWEAVDNDETDQAIEDAEVEVVDRKKELDTAQEDFDKYKNLPEDNAKRKDAETALADAQKAYDEAVRKHDELVIQRDQAQADFELATATQAEAQRTFDLTQTDPDPDQLQLANTRLENANAQMAAAQAAADNLELKAPFSGTVADLNIMAGQVISPGNWAVWLADTSEWYVETTDLTELDVVQIGLGQKADLTPDALPDLVLTGEVIEISQTPGQLSGDVVYKTRIRLDNVDPRLRWGMTFEVTFAEN